MGEVIKLGLEKIAKILGDVLENERRVEDSLKKFKRQDEKKDLSDLEKIQLQIYVVCSFLHKARE